MSKVLEQAANVLTCIISVALWIGLIIFIFAMCNYWFGPGGFIIALGITGFIIHLNTKS